MPVKKTRIRTTSQDLKILRILAAILFLAVMAAMPLYMTQKYAGLVQFKTNFYYAVTGVIAGLIIPFLAYNKFQVTDYFMKDEPRHPASFPEWALLSFVLLTLASAAFSKFPDVAWFGADGRYEGFWVFLCYGMTFFVIARFYIPRKWHLLIVAASSVAVSLYAVFQFVGFDFLRVFDFATPDPRFVDAAGNQLYGPLTASFRTTLGNANILAAYSSITVVLFAVLYAEEKSKGRFLFFAGSAMSFLLLLIAGSGGDGGKVGILAAMALLLPYWLSKRERFAGILAAAGGWCAAYVLYQGYLTVLKENADVSLMPSRDQAFLAAYDPPGILIFVALAVLLFGGWLFLSRVLKKWPEKFMKRASLVFLAAVALGGALTVEIIGSRQPGSIVWQAREVMHGRLGDDFGSSRGWIWKRGLSVIPENPVLGTGPDTFYYALGDALQTEAIERYGVVYDKAHNLYVQIAVCLGVPALLAFLAFLGGIFVPAAKKAFSRPLLLACGAAAVSYLVQCFFEVDIPADKPMLWALLGVMAGELWREKIGA
jgi:O-antigen ligase